MAAKGADVVWICLCKRLCISTGFLFVFCVFIHVSCLEISFCLQGSAYDCVLNENERRGRGDKGEKVTGPFLCAEGEGK
jgi:hypothetical protein